ncbi:DUF1365 domain-containing protein [Corallincola platygyrae]|uniref:DUF1365 domain-containing protein n=1 Tax=Corallincola platygyrae TaxID=1193278 RepID=A0ABW4XJM6_9GAMM
MTAEGIYFGNVMHARRAPAHHKFAYEISMLFLNLSNEGHWPSHGLWFGESGHKVARICSERHLSHRPEGSWYDRAQAELKELGATVKIDRIFVLCHPTYLGFHFSPLNIYYCYQGEELVYLLAEVSNTPWNERHRYLIDAKSPEDTPKDFQVSPFMGPDQFYRWNITSPADSLLFGITSYESDKAIFNASLQLKFLPLTSTNLKSRILRTPIITWKIFSGIYWQALKIWLKGVPFLGYTARRKEQS